ncbi:MAG: peptidoglycan editing factor PgeF [Oscillospiraceae bacterium]|nr:peptidoglycan editing factor PgeF [Oscillospiraceae bacterium]
MIFSEITDKGLTYLTAPNISASHAFTTRCALFEEKSKSSDMRMLCGIFGLHADNFVYSHQVHGHIIRVITKKDKAVKEAANPPDGDGLVTQIPGIALTVFSADCVPILLHDPVKHVVAAVHAGWRGTSLNIAQAAVHIMQSEFGSLASDVQAAIGPSISKCCFETNEDVKTALYKALGSSGDLCVSASGGKYLIDLKKANRLMLSMAGVENISISGDCTVCTDDKYWSHRKHGSSRGSQAAMIWL